MSAYSKEGQISEWNEGTLKSIRLHEAQQMINLAKVDLLRRLPDGSHNYDLWFAGINNLYGEGYSKYKETERVEVDKVYDLIQSLLAFLPPFKYASEDSFNGKKQREILNAENWKSIKKLGEIFEKKVKIYNDAHGFSTKNQGTKGMF